MATRILMFSVFCATLLLIVISIVRLVVKKERNDCRMTYMYEVPEFIPLSINREAETKFPNYKLFVYGEGSYAYRLRERKYNGIPVLFLPGNAGSFKQVRSLASVALTKAQTGRSPFHFNYFTVDFSEEMSAFYGAVLYRQADFSALCVKHILSLYQDASSRPSSVIIVGHSMGGLVARAMFSLANLDPSMVDVIFTLASPHLKPVLLPDPFTEKFYRDLNSYWTENRKTNLSHINLISIGGGRNDLMVRSDLVDLPWRYTSSGQDIVVVATAIPRVLTSADHLCILWCNQLVLRTVWATFELVDKGTRQIEKDVNKRTTILWEAFSLNAVKFRQLPSSAASSRSWVQLGSWQGQYRYTVDPKRHTTLLLPLDAGMDVVMLFNGAVPNHGIFGCEKTSSEWEKNNSDICDSVWVLPCEPLSLSTSGNKLTNRGVFRCREDCCKGATHLIIPMVDNQMKVDIIAGSYNFTASNINVTLWDLFAPAIVDVPERSLFIQIGFPDFTYTWRVYEVTFVASGAACPDDAGVSHFHIPWSAEDTFETIQNSETVHILKLYVPNVNGGITGFPTLLLYLHTDCKYSVKVELSLTQSLEQIVLFNYGLIPGFLTAALLLALSKQLSFLSVSSSCPPVCYTLSLRAVIRDLAVVYASAALLQVSAPGLPINIRHPVWTLSDGRFFNFFISLLLYVAGNAVVGIVSTLTSAWLKLGAVVAAKMMDLCRCCPTLQLSCITRNSLSAAFIGLVLYVSSTCCGGYALLILQFVSAVWAFLQHLQSYRAGNTVAATTRSHLSVAMYLVSLLMFSLSCPALIFWAKSESSIGPLNPDSSFVQAVVVTFIVLGHDNIEGILNASKWSQALMASTLWLSSLGTLLFSLEHLYWLSCTLTLNFVVLTCWPVLELCWIRLGKWRKRKSK